VEVRDSFGAVSKPKTIQVISQWPKLESEAEATAATGALLGTAEAALKAGGPEAGRCRLTVSRPVLKEAPMVSALEIITS
jgi:hypothetical protein